MLPIIFIILFLVLFVCFTLQFINIKVCNYKGFSMALIKSICSIGLKIRALMCQGKLQNIPPYLHSNNILIISGINMQVSVSVPQF